MVIIGILGLKVVFEVRKKVQFAVWFAGMQYYVFSKICNEGGSCKSSEILDTDVKHFKKYVSICAVHTLMCAYNIVVITKCPLYTFIWIGRGKNWLDFFFLTQVYAWTCDVMFTVLWKAWKLQILNLELGRNPDFKVSSLKNTRTRHGNLSSNTCCPAGVL